MPRCSWNSIRCAKVFRPSPTAQRRIAEVLSTLDEAVERTEGLIAKQQHIKAGLMHDLLTRGVTPDGRLRPTHAQAPELYYRTPLGWIPNEWEVATIRDLFTRRTERGFAGLPIMSIIMGGGMVPRESVDRRVESNLTPEQHLLVREGDIAYNMMRMWQGVLGRAKHDGLVSPAYIVMKPGSRIQPEFAEYLLSTKSSIARFKQLSFGVVDDRLRLYGGDLMRVTLAVPKQLSEQERISARLSTISEAISGEAIYLAKLRQQKQGLMQDLLTGRVAVTTG
jgi:type I restriction enzyme S subunit